MSQFPMLFDGHVHLRVGEIMEAVIPQVALFCQAVVVMPNTAKIRTGAQAKRHRDEITAIAKRVGFPNFRPLMTVLLTDDTDPADVATWPDANIIAGKYYPADLYPHGGVSDLDKIDDVLCEMWRVGIPLSGHFEKSGVHPLDAELAAIPDFLHVADRGDVRAIFEHASTIAALEAIQKYPHAAATITPQHLWMVADDVYDISRGNIRHPHNWCRPVAKTSEDREALRIAAMSGSPKIFFGSDFAPHLAFSKVNVPPPAGCACYPSALPSMVELFAHYGRLDQLSDFTSGHAARFYGIQLDSNVPPLTITEKEWIVPGSIFVGSQGERIVPWLAETVLSWKVS